MHSHPFKCTTASRQSGAALVIALLVFALCTTLIVAMKREFTLFYQRGSNVFVAEQAYSYLRSAEDLAAMALQADYDEDQLRDSPRDDLTELWAGPPLPYSPDESSRLEGYLEDLQGRINLNTLRGKKNKAGEAPGYTASQQQFIRLLQALPEVEIGETEAIIITRAIGDWLDSDLEPSDNGAEDDYYFSRTPSYRAANRSMASASELRAVANITPEIFLALAPWVTVLPEDVVAMNIHTAPRVLLRTINDDGDLQPLSEADAESLFSYRRENGFADKDEFIAHSVFSGKAMTKVAENLGEVSAYFLLSATAEVADRRVRLYSVLERRGRAVKTLARASGSL